MARMQEEMCAIEFASVGRLTRESKSTGRASGTHDGNGAEVVMFMWFCHYSF